MFSKCRTSAPRQNEVTLYTPTLSIKNRKPDKYTDTSLKSLTIAEAMTIRGAENSPRRKQQGGDCLLLLPWGNCANSGHWREAENSGFAQSQSLLLGLRRIVRTFWQSLERPQTCSQFPSRHLVSSGEAKGKGLKLRSYL